MLAATTGSHASLLARLLRALVTLDVFVEVEADVFGRAALGEQLQTSIPGSLRNFATSRPRRRPPRLERPDRRSRRKYASARCSEQLPLKRLTMDEKAVLVRGSKQDRDIDAGHSAIVLLEPIRDCQPLLSNIRSRWKVPGA